jgi:hypothetical protein
MQRRSIVLTLIVLLSSSSGEAIAACQCACVNGGVQAICQSTMDLPPLCSPTLCPLTPPALAPLNPPHLPPLGTSQCRPRQVFDPNLGRYVWRELCE